MANNYYFKLDIHGIKVLGFLGLKSLAIAFCVFIYPVLFFFYAPQKTRNFSVMTALFFSILYKKEK